MVNVKLILKEYVNNKEKNELNRLESVFNQCLDNVVSSHKKIKGVEPNIGPIDVMFDDTFKDGKIGAFVHPKFEGDVGKLLIKRKAVSDGGFEYIKHIITHELLHACLGYTEGDSHNEEFIELSKEVGLPVEYRS